MIAGEPAAAAGFVELPVTHRHAVIAGRLPLPHGDPFDRMLIAQDRRMPRSRASETAAVRDDTPSLV